MDACTVWVIEEHEHDDACIGARMHVCLRAAKAYVSWARNDVNSSYRTPVLASAVLSLAAPALTNHQAERKQRRRQEEQREEEMATLPVVDSVEVHLTRYPRLPFHPFDLCLVSRVTLQKQCFSSALRLSPAVSADVASEHAALASANHARKICRE